VSPLTPLYWWPIWLGKLTRSVRRGSGFVQVGFAEVTRTVVFTIARVFDSFMLFCPPLRSEGGSGCKEMECRERESRERLLQGKLGQHFFGGCNVLLGLILRSLSESYFGKFCLYPPLHQTQVIDK
jgi:hypothetical protein